MYPLGERYGFDVESDGDSDEFRFICAIAQRKILQTSTQQEITDELVAIAPMVMGSCDPSLRKGVVHAVLTDEAVCAEFTEYPIYRSLMQQAEIATQ